MPAKSELAKAIDQARCDGDWKAIPRLVKRSSAPDVYLESAAAEASLQAACDDTLDGGLEANKIEPIRQKLVHAMEHANPTEKEFTKIILGRTYFESGDFKKAFELVQRLRFNNKDIADGYPRILFLQARVIKAISLEWLEKYNDALETYKGVLQLVRSSPNLKTPSFVSWAEIALYRGSLLALDKSQDTSFALAMLRAYQRVTTSQTWKWRLAKRMVITRRSLEFLPVAYERGEYTLPSGSSASPEERSAEVKEKEERLFRLELSQLHILYRKMLFDTVSIPHAGQVHHDLVYWVNQIAKDVQRILWPTADLREFKESLFQVVSRSFNSPSVMRALFYVHAMLGELTEALQALHAYLYLVGLISQATDDIKGTGEASLLGKDGVMRAVPSNHEGMLRELVRDSVEDNASQEGADENRRSMAAHRSSEQEPPVEILRVLLSAARLCCTDLDEPVKAVELAKLALLELQVRPTDRECQVLAGAVHRVAGAAYSFQASKTIDPDRRPEFHRTAKKYILQAVEIDGEAWQSWYQLALERCQSRDIEHGIDAIVKALQLNASHIPSWHLLALALSCPKIRSSNPDALIKALESCDAGLRVPLDGIWATDEDLGWQPNYEQFVERLELQVTRALVLSKIEGYDSALGALQNAFAAFASLPPEHQQQMSSGAGDVAYTHGPLAVTSGSLYNLSEAELSGSFASGQVSAVPNDQRQPQQQGSLPNLPQTQQARAGLMQKTDSSDPSVQTAPAARPSKEQYGIRLFRHRNTGSKSYTSLRNYAARGTQPAQASVLSVQTTPTIAPTSAAGGTATAPQAGMDAQKLRPSARCRTRQKGSARLLCDLWLVAARLYLQQQRWDEALKAVEEAEQIEWSTYADLWCVLGQVRFAQPPQDEENSLTTAIACFLKGLACDTNDVGCRLWLARACTAVQQDTMAQGILDRLTRGPGWDCPEAWFFLGRIHDEHGRAERAKECFLYALELERSQPIRSFSRVSRFPGYFWHLGEV